MSVPSAPHQRAASKNQKPCPKGKHQPRRRLQLPGATCGGALLLLLISLGLDLGSVHCYGEYQRPTILNKMLPVDLISIHLILCPLRITFFISHCLGV